jgi:hypothetical protein
MRFVYVLNLPVLEKVMKLRWIKTPRNLQHWVQSVIVYHNSGKSYDSVPPQPSLPIPSFNTAPYLLGYFKQISYPKTSH